jgi:uncharacterized membrane protein YeiB
MPETDLPEEEIQPDPVQAAEPEPEPIPLTPVARQERIAAMDVLRGIAVFGIFLINMPLYLAPSSAFFGWEDSAYWTRESDRLATLFIYIFAQGKFYTLFSFLFGLGFCAPPNATRQTSSPPFVAVSSSCLPSACSIGR